MSRTKRLLTPFALRQQQQKKVNLLGELEGEGELVPSCLQDGDLTIVCGQNRFKTIISLLQNFLPRQISGGDVQYTAKEQHNGTGIFLPGFNCSSTTTAVT